jgi:GNAT superfamily N-acetyltransferase
METFCKTLGEDTFIYFGRRADDALDQVGYIHFVIHSESEEATICYIYVNDPYRNKGFAKHLMSEMISNVRLEMGKSNCKRCDILLDDMTDRYGKEDNLYKKFGFNYCYMDENGPCGPEMMLTISL